MNVELVGSASTIETDESFSLLTKSRRRCAVRPRP